MKKARLILALFLLSFSPIFSAKVINIDNAVRTALENNHNLKLAEYDLQIAEQDVKEAFGYALPTLTMNGNLQHFLDVPDFVFGGGGFGFPDAINQFIIDAANDLGRPNPFTQIVPTDPAPIPGGLRNTFSTGLQLNQTLFNYTVFTGIGATGTYKKAQMENLNSQEAKTVQNAKKAFYAALLAKESITLVESSYENAKKRQEEISILFENGLVSEYDELRAKVQVQNLNTEVLNARTNFQNALNALKITIGLAIEEEVDLAGSLDSYRDEYLTPDKSETTKSISSGNFDLKAVDYQIEVQDAFVSSEVSSFYPVLNLFGSYSFQGQADDFDFITFEQSVVGVQMQWTLFQGFQRSAKLQKAKVNKEKAKIQKDLLEKSLNNQAEILALRMKTAKEQIEVGNITVNQAERGYEISKTRYTEGVGSLIEMNDADLALRQARLNKLQAIYNYLVAEAEYDNLKGNK